MLPAPAAETLPVYPASWYLFCSARRLRRGPFARDLLSRRLVVYRTAAGRLAALDARCAHLGADLGEAVEDDPLRVLRGDRGWHFPFLLSWSFV